MEEVEIAERGGDEFELVQVSPMRRLEGRVKQLEYGSPYSGLPQLQTLINQIIELVKSNQRIIDEVIKANSDLRSELSKLPPRIDELVRQMKDFMHLLSAAGSESEVSIPSDMMSPVTEQLQKIADQNQKLLESNQEMIGAMGEMNKKIRTGTPVSQLFASYPRISIRSLQKK